MIDIIRSAISAQLTEFPLSWRKDAPDHWVAKVGDLTCCVWPSYGRGGWGWELTGRGNSEVANGQSDDRRGAMNAAEAAAKQHLPTQTDVQIVTGRLAYRSEVPAEVLAAAIRLAEQERASAESQQPESVPLRTAYQECPPATGVGHAPG